MSTSAPKPFPCPHCQKPCELSPENPFRPFCSKRCKLIDFGQWADEGYRLPTEQGPDSEEPLHES